MNFISIQFLFGFLPVVLGIWIILTRKGLTPLAMIFLSVASAMFYAEGSFRDLLLIIVSALFNYGLALAIASSEGKVAVHLLRLGVILNCLFLAYYKYAAFLLDAIFQSTGYHFIFSTPAFPVGISFYTLQQVAYLVIVNRDRHAERDPWNYFSFVLFFPKLIAGPIVYSTEYFAQLNDEWKGYRTRFEDISIGLVLFCFGAFKKAVISEPFSQTANQVFGSVGQDNFSLLSAWTGITAYTLQLYFDFSGYSDMAIGIGRMFGFKLPQNFNSPLRATSMLEFWRGWHMTMTRFFMDHIYNPIAIRLTRREMAANSGRVRMFFITAALPTIVTFVMSGIWHGAGWKFVCFGLVHGVALSVNQAWRTAKMPSISAPLGWVLMFMTLMISLVFVRTNDLGISISFLKIMFASEVVWPGWLGYRAGLLPGSVGEVIGLSREFVVYLIVGFGIIFYLPNLQWLLRHYSPTFGYKQRDIAGGVFRKWVWSPTMFWAVLSVIVLLVSMLNMNSQSPYIYLVF